MSSFVFWTEPCGSPCREGSPEQTRRVSVEASLGSKQEMRVGRGNVE